MMDEFYRDWGYSQGVRIGNWVEQYSLEQDEMREFLERKEKNDLTLQKTRRLFSNFYKEVELSFLRRLRFGTMIQVVPTRMKICEKFKDYKPTLSITPSEDINESQEINDRCEITIAPSISPCVRNTFVIKSGDKKDRNNEFLHFGQDFILECVDTEKDPLVLYSAPKRSNLTNLIPTKYYSINDKGEINLPVGLCSLRNTGPEESIPLAYCRWKCLHKNANKRFETEGQSFTAVTEIVITHSVTNRHLAAENIEISTIFGPECLVSVNNYLDAHKREKWQNYWRLSTGTKDTSK